MELQRYLEALRRRYPAVLTVAVVTLLFTALARYVVPPLYEARSTIRVFLDVGVPELVRREDYNSRLLNTYAEVLASEAMLDRALTHLSATSQPGSLVRHVSVKLIPNTELLLVTVRSPDPRLALNLANALSALLPEYTREKLADGSEKTRQIMQEQVTGFSLDLEEMHRQRGILAAFPDNRSDLEAIDSQIELKENALSRLLDRYELVRLNGSLRADSIAVVFPATMPSEPVNRPGLRDMAIALAVGLLGAIGFAMVLENLDTRIHGSRQLESLPGVPVLGSVPEGFLSTEDLDGREPPAGRMPVREAYRLLCTNLLVLRGQLRKRERVNLGKILVTSAAPSEGRSMVAANLARVFADQGQSVVLVESDLRNPVLAGRFGLDCGMGLGSLPLAEKPGESDALARLICPTGQPGLCFVASGPWVPNPTALLAAPSIGRLLESLEQQGGVVVLDSSPVIGVADTSVLASRADGVVLVVRQSLTRREALTQALRQLRMVEARVLGIIFVQKRGRDRS